MSGVNISTASLAKSNVCTLHPFYHKSRDYNIRTWHDPPTGTKQMMNVSKSTNVETSFPSRI